MSSSENSPMASGLSQESLVSGPATGLNALSSPVPSMTIEEELATYRIPGVDPLMVDTLKTKVQEQTQLETSISSSTPLLEKQKELVATATATEQSGQATVDTLTANAIEAQNQYAFKKSNSNTNQAKYDALLEQQPKIQEAEAAAQEVREVETQARALYEEKTGALATVELNVEAETKKVKELEETLDRLEFDQGRLTELEADLTTQRSVKDGIASVIQDKTEQLTTLTEQLPVQEKAYTDAVHLEASLATTQQEMALEEAAMKTAVAAQEAIQTSIEEKKKEIEGIEADISVKQEASDKAATLRDVLSRKLQKLASIQAEVEALQKSSTELGSTLVSLEDSVEDATEKYNASVAAATAAKEKLEQLLALQKEISEAEAAVRSLEETNQAQERELGEKRAAIPGLEAAVTEASSAKTALEGQKASLTGLGENVAAAEGALVTAATAAATATGLVKAQEAALAAAQAAVEAAKTTLSQKEEMLRSLAQLQTDINNKSIEVAELSKKSDTVTVNPAQVALLRNLKAQFDADSAYSSSIAASYAALQKQQLEYTQALLDVETGKETVASVGLLSSLLQVSAETITNGLLDDRRAYEDMEKAKSDAGIQVGLPCTGVQARRLVVKLFDLYTENDPNPVQLSFSQIAVYNTDGVNVALRKPAKATQPSAAGSALPIAAVDGIMTPRSDTTIYKAAEADTNGTWEVDFEATEAIAYIIVVAPKDNIERIQKLSLFLYDTDPENPVFYESSSKNQFNAIECIPVCPEAIDRKRQRMSPMLMRILASAYIDMANPGTPTQARYLRLQPSLDWGDGVLNFSELQVFTGLGGRLQGSATAFSAADGFTPEMPLQFDGRPKVESKGAYRSNGALRDKEYWQLDFGQMSPVGFLLLFNIPVLNRANRAQFERPIGVRASLLDDAMNVVAATTFRTADTMEIVSFFKESLEKRQKDDDTARAVQQAFILEEIERLRAPLGLAGQGGSTCTPVRAKMLRVSPSWDTNFDVELMFSQIAVYNTKGENVALRRPTSATNYEDRYTPDVAVDGEFIPRANQYYKSRQNQVLYSKWEVAFDKEEDITHVVLVGAATVAGVSSDWRLNGLRFELLDSEGIVVKRNLARTANLLQVVPFCAEAMAAQTAAEQETFEKTTLANLRKGLMDGIQGQGTPVKARYIRMWPGAVGANGFILTCSQVLVYGPDGNNLALQKPVNAFPGMYNAYSGGLNNFGLYSPPTILTDGNVRPRGLRDVYQSPSLSNSISGYVQIDLEAEQDITHLIYINRADMNKNSARGLRFQLLNAAQTVVADRTLPYDVNGEAVYQILGFTPEMVAAADKNLTPALQANLAKIKSSLPTSALPRGTTPTPVRGRYVRMYSHIADSTVAGAKSIKLSQLAVFSDTDVNLALRKKVTAVNITEQPITPFRLLTDGYYDFRIPNGYAQINPSNSSQESYIEIDLEQESNVSYIGLVSSAGGVTNPAVLQLSGITLSVLDANRTITAMFRTPTVYTPITGFSMSPQMIQWYSNNYNTSLTQSAFYSTITNLRTTNKVTASDTCTPHTARYVRILPSETSTDDVMQFSQLLVFNPSGQNIAYMKNVTGVGINVLFPPNLITDGTVTSRAGTSCYTSTGSGRTYFLEIDLLKDELITHAVLFNNGTATTMPRSQGLRLQLLDSNKCVVAQRLFKTAEEVQLVSLCKETEEAAATEVVDETSNKTTLDAVRLLLPTYSMPATGQPCTPLKARFMQIYPNTLSTEATLAITQVMVYNQAGRNIARHKPCFALNQLNNTSGPSEATDGNYLVSANAGRSYVSTAFARGTNYMEIDWGSMEDLTYAVIVNQQNATLATEQNRINGVPVLFFDDKRQLVYKTILRKSDRIQLVPLCLEAITAEAAKQATADVTTFSPTVTAINALKTQYSITDTGACTGPTARYVRIKMPLFAQYGQQLTISQIQVYNIDNKNVAFNKPTKANAVTNSALHHSCVTDGILIQRPNTQCYRSIVQSYATQPNETEFVQVDLLQSETIRYVVVVGPNNTPREMFKARVQLLDDTETLITERTLETNDVVHVVNFCKEADDRRRAADLQTQASIEQSHSTFMNEMKTAMQPNMGYTPVRGRYVRIRPSMISRNAVQKLAATQILVFNKQNQNIAFKCPVDATTTTLSTGLSLPNRLTNGVLDGALPFETYKENRITEYVEIDLGSEQDILHIAYFNRSAVVATDDRAVGLRVQVLDANRNLVKEKQLLGTGNREILCMAPETEAAEEKAQTDARYLRNKTSYDSFPALLKSQAFIEDGQTYTPTPARYLRILPSETNLGRELRIASVFVYNAENKDIALFKIPNIYTVFGNNQHLYSEEYPTQGEIDNWSRYYASNEADRGLSFFELDFGKLEQVKAMILNFGGVDADVAQYFLHTRIQLLDENRKIIRERLVQRLTKLQAISFCDETIPKELDSIRIAKINAIQAIVSTSGLSFPCKGTKARKVILRPSVAGDGVLNFTRIQVFNTKGEMVSKNKYITARMTTIVQTNQQPAVVVFNPSILNDDNSFVINGNLSNRRYITQTTTSTKWAEFLEIDLGQTEEIMYVVYYHTDPAGGSYFANRAPGTRIELTDETGRLVGLRTVPAATATQVLSFCETDVSAEMVKYESAQSAAAIATLPATIDKTCAGTVGRKICIRPSLTAVNGNTGIISLSQIMAFGASGTNLALGKRVFVQNGTSSTITSLYQMITDGIASTRPVPSMATTSGPNRLTSMISVDLGTDTEIRYIVLYNRSDFVREGLSGARVQILDAADKVVFEGTLPPTTADVYSINTCASTAVQAGGGTIDKVFYDSLTSTIRYLAYVKQFKLNTDKAVDKLQAHVQAIIDSTIDSKTKYETLKAEMDKVAEAKDSLIASYTTAQGALDALRSKLLSTYGEDLSVHTAAKDTAAAALTDAEKKVGDETGILTTLTSDEGRATAAKAAAEQALADARAAQAAAVTAMGELDALVQKIIAAGSELSRREEAVTSAKSAITTLETIKNQTDGLLAEAKVKVDGKKTVLRTTFGEKEEDWASISAAAAAAEAAKNLDSKTMFQINEQLGKTQTNSQYTATTLQAKQGELALAQKDVEGQSLEELTKAAQDALVELQNAQRALEKAVAELAGLEDQLKTAAAAATEQVRKYEAKRAALQGILGEGAKNGEWIRTQRLAAEKLFQESTASKAMLEQDLVRLKADLDAATAKYTEMESRVNAKIEEIRMNYSMNADTLEAAATEAAAALRDELARKERARKDMEAAKATFFAATSAREMADSNLTTLLQNIRLQYGNTANVRSKLDTSLVELRELELAAKKAADELDNYQAMFATMKAERTKAEVDLAKMVAAVEVAQANLVAKKKEVEAARAALVAAVAAVKAAEEAARIAQEAANAAARAAAEEAARLAAAEAAAKAAAEQAAVEAEAAAKAAAEAEAKRLEEEAAAKKAANTAAAAAAEEAARVAAEAAAAAEAARVAAEEAAAQAAADAEAAAKKAAETEATRLAEEAAAATAAAQLQADLEAAHNAVDTKSPLPPLPPINISTQQNPLEYLETARNNAEAKQRAAAAARNAQLAAKREINALSSKANTNSKTINELLMEIGNKMKELRSLKNAGVRIGGPGAAAAATTTPTTDNAGEWKEGEEPVMPLANEAPVAETNLFEPEPETWAQMAERMGYLG